VAPTITTIPVPDPRAGDAAVDDDEEQEEEDEDPLLRHARCWCSSSISISGCAKVRCNGLLPPATATAAAAVAAMGGARTSVVILLARRVVM
jgi:hypothetical protein